MSHKNPRGRGGPAYHQYRQRSRADSEDDTRGTQNARGQQNSLRQKKSIDVIWPISPTIKPTNKNKNCTIRSYVNLQTLTI